MEARPVGTHERGSRAIACFDAVVLIMGPRDAVFESLATREHAPRWSAALEDDGGTEPAPTGSFEITAYEPPGRLKLAGHIGGFEAVVDYKLDELALGTLVTCRTQVDLTSVVLEADVRLATSLIESAITRSIDRSKQILETEDPT
jgi:hypothetical protein